MKDYYTILDVESDASYEDIKKQYRFLVRAFHPDKFSQTPHQQRQAQKKVQEVNQAYEVLSNPTQRMQYDQQRAHTGTPPASAAEYQQTVSAQSSPPYASRHSYEQNPSPGTWRWLYGSCEGRIGRNTYWLRGVIPFNLIYLGVVIIDIFLQAHSILMWIGLMLLAWPAFALNVKRLHDRGKSGWWMVISLLPYLGGLWLFIELGWRKGQCTANQYGPAP